jgi:Na+/proline symporter
VIWDILIFGLYVMAVFLVGIYFFRRNKTSDDYYAPSSRLDIPTGLAVRSATKAGCW